MTGQPAAVVNTKPTEKNIRESTVITFGRFNPPTKGHTRLVERMKQLAEEVGADGPAVYLSHSYDPIRNPLDYETKVHLCTEAFGEVVVHSPAKNIFEVLTELTGHFKNVYIVLGEDRAETMAKRLEPYLGELFDFDSIEVVGIERDEFSSSKARQFVSEEDFDSFAACLPTEISDIAGDLFETIFLLRQEKQMSEMTSDKLVRYFDRATADRAKAEKEGDEKRVKKRTKGAFRALDKFSAKLKQGKE